MMLMMILRRMIVVDLWLAVSISVVIQNIVIVIDWIVHEIVMMMMMMMLLWLIWSRDYHRRMS